MRKDVVVQAPVATTATNSPDLSQPYKLFNRFASPLKVAELFRQRFGAYPQFIIYLPGTPVAILNQSPLLHGKSALWVLNGAKGFCYAGPIPPQDEPGRT